MKSNNFEQLPSRFNDLRDLLVDCYNIAAEVPQRIEVYNENPLQVIASCLFIKVLNTTRAELLLFQNNLLAEIYVLLRHQMEAVFVLKACNEDNTFLGEYIESDTLHRLKLGNVIIHNRDDFDKVEEFDIEKINTLKTELKSIVDKNGIEEIKVEELARKAKLESFYNTAYRQFSNIAHVGVRSLEDYLILGDGKIKELTLYPYQNDIAKLYITAIELIIIAIECTTLIFGIDLEEKLKRLKEKLDTVAKPYL